MVIDTSALVAIIEREEEALRFASAIVESSVRLMSAASFLETAIIIETRYGEQGGQLLNELVAITQIQILPVTLEQVNLARLAYRQYGKGHHEARLNFGDCFTYALAKIMNEPLLFKGNDFDRTDLLVVTHRPLS